MTDQLTDRMTAELREQLGNDFADLDEAELFRRRDEIASHYMLYAVKALPEYANRTPDAEAIRTMRRDALAELWLHLNRLCAARVRS